MLRLFEPSLCGWHQESFGGGASSLMSSREPNMQTYCECTHERRRHRVSYGRPGFGACYACHCSVFKRKTFALSPGERRVLAKIAEFPVIGHDLLLEMLEKAEDPASDALGAINRNLLVAGFLKAGPLNSVAVTEAGEQYLKEKPLRG